MSGPYLESGESIVLTADRVSLDQIIYEAMLTNRQLILIDSLNARFEPRIIPLAAIQSVRSGKAATGEPVISLAVRQPDENEAAMSIILFLQEPLESRKHDRDLWVKKLIELSVSGRAEHVQDKPEPAGEGIRPSVRRWIAPDITRPQPENFPAPSRNMIITMDEPEPEALPEMTPAMHEPVESAKLPEIGHEPAWPEISCSETVDSGAGFSEIPAAEPEGPAVPESELHDSSDDAVTIIPAEVGDTEPPTFQPPEATVTMAPGSLTTSILAAVQSLTRQQKPITPPPPDGTSISEGDEEELPETLIQYTSTVPENLVESSVMGSGEEPAAVYSPDLPEMPEQLPVFDEVEHGVRKSSLIPEILPEPPVEEEKPTAAEAEISPVSVTNVQPAISEHIPDKAIPKPVDEGLCIGPVSGPEEPYVPIKAEGTSTPRSTGPTSIRFHLIAGGMILIILLMVAAVIFLPGIQPQESPPVTVHPTTTPVITITATPTEAPPTENQATVPQEGVWVRIVSPGYFYGEAGNPGYLQPVSGRGEKIVSMRQSDGLVEVSIEKLDYANDELLVEIFNNGTLIISRFTTVPKGSIELLIDPATGNPPGIAPVTTEAYISGYGKIEYY